MNLNSKYFDSIRVKPDKDRRAAAKHPSCEWKDCSEEGKHLAPQGRGRDGQYFRFCLKHVREYNKTYNYFQGMSDEEISKFQKSAITGHRPTWSLGTNNQNGKKESKDGDHQHFAHDFQSDDFFDLFNEETKSKQAEQKRPQRPIRNMERKCLTQLNLDVTATKEEIKTRFKDLVKRHHPDLNQGDDRSQDKLREVIQAYNYLKKAGLC